MSGYIQIPTDNLGDQLSGFDPLHVLSKGNEPKTEHDAKLLGLKLRLTARTMRAVYEARKHPIGVWKICFHSDDGGAPIITWFHWEWTRLALENRFVMIEAPRESAKTSWAISMLLWFLGKRPDWRCRLLCEDDSSARKRLNLIRQLIKGNELLQLAFPSLRINDKERNDRTVMTIVRDAAVVDPSLEACGVLSAGTGSRCEFMALDDIEGYRNTLGQPALRDEVKKKMRSDWLPTLITRFGRLLDIFTPWHEESFNAETKEAGRWAYKRYAHGKEGNPYYSIFPQKVTEQDLKDRRIDMGATGYARAYLCVTLAKDAVLVLPEHLRAYKPHVTLTEYIARACTCVISIDPSKGDEISKGKDPDFHGITIGLVHVPGDAKDSGGQLAFPYSYRNFICDSYSVRMPASWLLYYAIQLCRDWGAEYLLIEEQGAIMLSSWIADTARFLPEIHPLSVGSIGKGARLQRITPLLDVPEEVEPITLFHPDTVQKKAEPHILYVTLRDGATYEVEANRNLRHQVLNFPTKKDDTLDSFTQFLWWSYNHLAPREADTFPGHAEVSVGSIEF